MKSINWLGFFGAMRPDTRREPGKLARIVELLSRGGIPVDGIEDSKPRPERPREPVRWGNFR
jgi:hypothetical protein